MATCSIPGCDEPVFLRGWCSPHYNRWRRYGDPEGGRRCMVCGEFVGQGVNAPYHTQCEPTLCTCDVGKPDGVGECQTCFRLVLSCSWHEGRPEYGPVVSDELYRMVGEATEAYATARTVICDVVAEAMLVGSRDADRVAQQILERLATLNPPMVVAPLIPVD